MRLFLQNKIQLILQNKKATEFGKTPCIVSYYIWEHHQSSAIDVWLAKIEKDRGLDALFLGCFHQWVTYLQLDG